MRKVGFVLGALVLLALALAPAFAEQPFSDVPQDHWAYAAIEKLAASGVIEGYPNGTFGGKRNMTRYEFAQAIARIVDRLSAGTKGEKGDMGPAGPAGQPGQVLTPEQQAALDKLMKEFAPELASLRADLTALQKRVEELEAAPKAAGPAVTVSGDISWRTGVYGTKLGFEDVASTGYPADWWDWYPDGGVKSGEGFAFGVIPVNSMEMFIPISDALKDAFKAGDFMTQRTRVNFASDPTPNTKVFVGLLSGPLTNIEAPDSPYWETARAFSGNGIMDTVKIDQAWLEYAGRFIAPVDVKIGKQYEKRGVGLLFDNDQEAVKALRADWGKGRLRFGTFLGMLDEEQFFARTFSFPMGVDPNTGEALVTDGQDNINLYYLDYDFGRGDRKWNLGVNWLESGFAKEAGWSGSLCGPLGSKLDLYGEWSRLTKWGNGKDFDDWDGDGIEDSFETPLSDSDTAWLAGLKWKASSAIELVGEYGQVDAGYALSIPLDGWDAAFGPGLFNLPLSALHPRAEIDPHDINWIDRPLFLDPTNIAKGWHVQATFPTLLGAKTPLTVSYAAGHAYNPDYLSWLYDGGTNSGFSAPDKWRDADSVWWVKLSRQFNSAVSANLVYGRRQVDNVMSPQEIPVSSGDGGVVFATDDPLQVIRAEVVVQF